MVDEPQSVAPAGSEPRRNFVTKFAAVVIGASVGLIPTIAAGIAFFDPLLRKKRNGSAGTSEGDGFIKVTTTPSLAADGTPRMFPVVADLQDAWNKFPNTEIGSVYLWHNSDGTVGCFSAGCPHLGCTVNYKPGESRFACPCHDSAFSREGERTNDIPPRSMDTLDADVRNDNEVWVRFVKYRAGIHEQIVV